MNCPKCRRKIRQDDSIREQVVFICLACGLAWEIKCVGGMLKCDDGEPVIVSRSPRMCDRVDRAFEVINEKGEL